MIKKIVLFLSIQLLCGLNLFSQPRSFDEIFPDIKKETRNAAFSGSGYVISGKRSDGYFIIANTQETGIDPLIVRYILEKNPSHIVESIYVLKTESNDATLLSVYNALGNIRKLKGRLYNSATRKQSIPLFEEATRVAGEKNTSSIADPPPSASLPRKDTVFLRLKDVNFGNSYYRADMELFQNGIRYSLSNFKSLSYLFVPVMKEEKFIAQLFFEPIEEGVLIYSLASADISDFIASKIDIKSAIAKRLAVIIEWAAEGILQK